MALSNLGELYYQRRQVDGAKQYWDSAIKANGKLIAARINLASLRARADAQDRQPKDAQWKKLEEDARFNLSNVARRRLPITSRPTPCTASIYMEGSQKNKNRLDLAKLLLDEGKKRNEKYAPLQNAYGLLLHAQERADRRRCSASRRRSSSTRSSSRRA